MLAYVFWHRPLDESASDAYEQALLAFHSSLARTPPIGFRGSMVFAVSELPWLASTGAPDAPGAGYEDWHLLEDYTALGVLNEAAVGSGHRTSHDKLARRFGAGAGGLYGLVEGHADLSEDSLAIWVARPPAGLPGSERRALPALLGDGMDPEHASLWRRQLVFGPAPEFCLLAPEPPAGVAPTRLPEGWSATIPTRKALWNG